MRKILKNIILIFISMILINITSVSIYADDISNYGYSEVYYDRLTGEEIGYDLYLDEKDATFRWEKPSEITKMIIYRSENYGEYIKLAEVDASDCYYKDITYKAENSYVYRVEAQFQDGGKDIFTELETEAGYYPEIDEEKLESAIDVGLIIIMIGVLIAFVVYIIGIIMLFIPSENKEKEELKEYKSVETILWTIFFWPVGLYKIIKYRKENNKGYYIKWILFLIQPLGLYILWNEDTFERKDKMLLTTATIIMMSSVVIIGIAYVIMLVAIIVGMI